jgi:hypothetical protein
MTFSCASLRPCARLSVTGAILMPLDKDLRERLHAYSK